MLSWHFVYGSPCVFLAVTPQCTENFKDKVTFGGRIRGQNTAVETRLIPSMRFTCNGTMVGFTVTGVDRNAGNQDPKIQVWRENKSQCGSYQKLASEIIVHASSCETLTPRQSQMQVRIFHCALHPALRVDVQYGDVLGIELPPINNADFDLYFTDGGPINYVFQQQLSNEIDTNINRPLMVEEQPQITLDVVSGNHIAINRFPKLLPFSLLYTDFHCGIGYPVVMSPGHARGHSSNITTRLIPDLKFTCHGIITQFTIGGSLRPGLQDPMIQVWRECTNQPPGTYFKPVPDIVVNETVCSGNVATLSMGVFQCTLKAAFRVEVQAGDILGLELPPTNDQDFEVHFTNTSGGPVNYVFQGQVLSTAKLAERDSEVNDQPQINITLAPSGITKSDYILLL